MTDPIVIKNYLTDKNQSTKKGKCIQCQKLVYWSADKLYSHKRSNCTIPKSEQHLWAAKPSATTMFVNVGVTSKTSASVHSNDEESASHQSTPGPAKVRLLESYVDRISQDESSEIKRLISRFVYRTGIPFRVVESNAFHELVKRLRPAFYKCVLPSAKTIAGSYLDFEYNRLKEIGYSYLKSATCYSITSDGWSNLNNEHMVNFIIHVPNQKPFFYKKVSTVGISQTAENVSSEIIKVYYY